MEQVGEAIFIAGNAVIVLGYLFVAAFIAPKLALVLRRTKVGGVVFFLTCGLTHLELILHAGTGESMSDAGHLWHSAPLHLIQAAAVVVFVEGLYAEFIKGGASWPPGSGK